MPIDRRHLLTGSLVGVAATPALAATTRAAPLARHGLDAADFGARANASDDQSAALQRAIDGATRARLPLWLAPGIYRAGGLKLAAGTAIAGMRGATRIVLTHGPSLLAAEHADTITLTGLVLDGRGLVLPQRSALARFSDVHALQIRDCMMLNAGGNGVALRQCDGAITHTTIIGAADNALFCLDSRGMIIAGNVIRGSGNGGIRVWQSERRYDGSLIEGNRVEDTYARAGGSGQNGNAINVFRAGNVIVRGNVIRSAAFSAIRGNAASDIQVIGNNCAALDEVAIYSEFDFQGAVIAENVINGAAAGVSVTNFKQGGRLAAVHGNLVRNCRPRTPDRPRASAGYGIGVEADTAVTGNMIESAATVAISVGWGPYMRNVAITGNVVRDCSMGVGISVVEGTGTAAISGNLFAGTLQGAIVGLRYHEPATGDLSLSGAERYPQFKISGNQVS